MEIRDFNIYNFYQETFKDLYQKLQLQKFQHIYWSFQYKKLFIQIYIALANREPVLLVGPMGTGKTLITQIFSEIFGVDYLYMNCHKGTEVSDFMGNWRPNRNREQIDWEIKQILSKYSLDDLSEQCSLAMDMINTKDR